MYGHSLIIIPSLEMYQEIILKRGINIDLTPVNDKEMIALPFLFSAA